MASPSFDFDDLLKIIEAPKALYPAVIDNVTFLEMKCLEDACFRDLEGQVIVSPEGFAFQFETALAEYAKASELSHKSVVFEQSQGLSTVRFRRDLSICIDEKQKVAKVPSGHGALASLFPRVKSFFPTADSLWIRNVDNVVGTRSDTCEATRRFFGVHATTLDLLRSIRKSLSKNDVIESSVVAKQVLDLWGIELGESSNALEAMVHKLFHSAPAQLDYLSVLARPLVTMGHVPNSGRDVGGTAVFANVRGIQQKICLEVPHASTADRAFFLEDATKATHFNPVFVAVEIPSNDQMVLWQDHPFWLIAQKKWRGQEVFYHESILYEVIGSSEFANVIFTEIPRSLFNPHKSLADAGSRYLRDWSDL